MNILFFILKTKLLLKRVFGKETEMRTLLGTMNEEIEKNEKGSKHRLCACNFRQVGQKSRFIIFIDDMFGKE